MSSRPVEDAGRVRSSDWCECNLHTDNALADPPDIIRPWIQLAHYSRNDTTGNEDVLDHSDD